MKKSEPDSPYCELVQICDDRRGASVETTLPQELRRQWLGGVLDVREHAGTTWLWAFPELLLWPDANGQVTWLFSPTNDDKRWCGDLWGLDDRGNLLLVELKRSNGHRAGDPFRDFVRFRAKTARQFQARALADHWFDLYLKELEHLPGGCDSPKRAPGILNYSSKRAELCRWPHLYNRISAAIREDAYCNRVRQALITRERRNNPAPHFVAFAVAAREEPPYFGRDAGYKRLEEGCRDRMHCRFAYAERTSSSDRVRIVSRTVDDVSIESTRRG